MANGNGLASVATKQNWSLAIWLANLFAIALLGVVGWAVSDMAENVRHLNEEYHNLDKRVSRMEGNRFTSGDANILMDRVMALSAEVKGIPREVPPKWFVERVKRLERKLDKVSDQQEDHLRNYHGLTR